MPACTNYNYSHRNIQSPRLLLLPCFACSNSSAAMSFILKKARLFRSVARATSSNGNPRHSASVRATAGSAEGTFGFCTERRTQTREDQKANTDLIWLLLQMIDFDALNHEKNLIRSSSDRFRCFESLKCRYMYRRGEYSDQKKTRQRRTHHVSPRFQASHDYYIHSAYIPNTERFYQFLLISGTR